MKYGLADSAIIKIQQVFESLPEIEEVILYGSRAKGNFKQGSDIDIVVIGNKVTGKVISKLSWLLDDLLLPYTFDIADFKEINSEELLAHIKTVGSSMYKTAF